MLCYEVRLFLQPVAQEVEERRFEAGEAIVKSGNVRLAELVSLGIALARQFVDDRSAGIAEAHDLGTFVHGFARGIVDGLAEDFHLVVAVHADDLGVASAHEQAEEGVGRGGYGFAGALDEVAATGYGIVMPSMEELHLEEPEIMKQGGRYGIRLRASAPSIHLMQANIPTEVAPIVGSERQSEELVHYLLQEFEENPAKIWESNIFGKSLHELVNEGLHNKLYRMPADARMKLQETIERVINEGCSGLICIIL